MTMPLQRPTHPEGEAVMSTPANPEPSNYDASRERFATSEAEPVEVTRTTRTTTTPDLRTPASGARPYGRVAADLGVDRESVRAREEERFGGLKIGSAFFGFMTAAGIAVLLLALLSAAGVVLSLTSHTSTGNLANQAAAGTGTAKTIGLVGAILLLVVLFLAYYCGGYVAGRMARFNGTKQGLAVWLWSILFAGVIALLAKVAGSKYNILSNLNLPRIPVGEGTVTTAGVIAIIAVILVSLGAALLGGKAGMHFHRKVDKAGLVV